MKNIILNLCLTLISCIIGFQTIVNIPDLNSTPKNRKNEIEEQLYERRETVAVKGKRKIKWNDLENFNLSAFYWCDLCTRAWNKHQHKEGNNLLNCDKTTKSKRSHNSIRFQQRKWQPKTPIDVLKCECNVRTKANKTEKDTLFITHLHDNVYIQLIQSNPPLGRILTLAGEIIF